MDPEDLGMTKDERELARVLSLYLVAAKFETSNSEHHRAHIALPCIPFATIIPSVEKETTRKSLHHSVLAAAGSEHEAEVNSAF